MPETDTEIIEPKHSNIESLLETAAGEATRFLIKAFRHAVRLDEIENRALLGAATATVGAYTRNRATTSSMQQTRLIEAKMLVDPVSGTAVAGLLGKGDGG